MRTERKALTLHQPWASLVAIGAKTIETRSWATPYRGELWIHSAARLPLGEQHLGPWITRRYDHQPPYQPRTTRAYVFRHPEWEPYQNVDLPLGVVVARCQLVDCVPTHDLWECDPVQWSDDDEDAEHLRLAGWGRDGGSPAFVITDQLPLGDYTPGNFAWLLEDIEPIEPVTAKGGQRIWNWRAE